MANLIGVATISGDGFKEVRCFFCGNFMKIKIHPDEKNARPIKCTKCHAFGTTHPPRMAIKEGRVGVEIDLCLWTAVKE